MVICLTETKTKSGLVSLSTQNKLYVDLLSVVGGKADKPDVTVLKLELVKNADGSALGRSLGSERRQVGCFIAGFKQHNAILTRLQQDQININTQKLLLTQISTVISLTCTKLNNDISNYCAKKMSTEVQVDLPKQQTHKKLQVFGYYK